MAKVGRNDPCPCGSGKKYKHCCMRKDQTAQRNTVRLRRAKDTLPQKLWRFATQRRFAADLTAGYSLFWNNRYQMDDLQYMEPQLRWRFIDWYIHDFRTSESRETPAELFAGEHGADLQPGEREILDAHIDSVLSVYEVVEEPDQATGYLQLEDMVQGGGGPMQRLPSFDLHEGDIFWSRLISIQGVYVPVSISLLLSPEVFDGLEAILDYHFERYQAVHYQATRRTFLKDSGYLFNHYFMNALREEVPTKRRVSDEEVAHDAAKQLEEQIIVGSMEQHYERWLDTPIPAWEDKSPRELAKTAEGRQRVLLVLSEVEQIEERKRITGQPHYDVERLKERLGLAAQEGVVTSGRPVIYRPR